MLRIIKFIVCCAFLFSIAVFADEIPVEDLSQSDTAAIQNAPDTQDLSAEQRLQRLEQQMQNLTQMNMPQQIDDLRSQIQTLQGELDTQQHNLQALNKQLRDFYQDLNQRLGTLQAVPASAASKDSVVQNDQLAGDAEDQAYKQAFDLLVNKKYSDALSQMQHYLKQYPEGKYVVNAHYWLGEIYYMQSKLKESAKEMQTVVEQYSSSTKVPDAMYRLGTIYGDQKKTEQARNEFVEIIKKFPDSAAAKLANQQLQKMKQGN